MKDLYPPRLRNMRCNGCKQTVTLVLIYDEYGRRHYECAGDEKNRINGCGRRMDLKGGDDAKV